MKKIHKIIIVHNRKLTTRSAYKIIGCHKCVAEDSNLLRCRKNCLFLKIQTLRSSESSKNTNDKGLISRKYQNVSTYILINHNGLHKKATILFQERRLLYVHLTSKSIASTFSQHSTFLCLTRLSD